MDKRIAVLIGASQFPDDTKLDGLQCPEHDVDDLEVVLSDPARGAFNEVHVLKNEPHHQVLRTINQVLKRAEKDAFVLIYYSGHGKLDSAGRLYLAMTDTEIELLEATAVPAQSIKTFIDVSPSTATALVLDCCYGGAVKKAFFKGTLDEQLDHMSGGRGTFIMTASTALQLAKENEGDRNGIFTKHLIEGIRSGAADRDGDGVITMDELYRYVHQRVTAESHQEPVKSDVGVRGELIVAKSGRMPRKERRRKIQRRLYGLGSRGTIAHDVVSDAITIADTPKRELDPREREYDQLLDDFMAKKLSVGEFVRQWYAVPSVDVKPEPVPRRVEGEAEEEAHRKASEEAEAKDKEEEEAHKRAEAEARRKEEEERKRVKEETTRKAEEEERQRAEAEAERKAEEERQRAEEEAERKAEEVLKEMAEAREAEVREAEAKRKAAKEERKRAEAEAEGRAENEERKRAEAEANRKRKEELDRYWDVRLKAKKEAEEKIEVERKAEDVRIAEWIEAERKVAEEEAGIPAETKQKAKFEEHKYIEADARRKADEKRQRAEVEPKRRAEEALKEVAAARRYAAAERKRVEDARRRADKAGLAIRESLGEVPLQAVEEARRKALDEHRRPKEEAQRKAEEEHKGAKVEAERKVEERRIPEWIEAERRATEEEARVPAVTKAKKKGEPEERKRAEADAQRKAEDVRITEWVEAEREATKPFKQSESNLEGGLWIFLIPLVLLIFFFFVLA